MEDKMFSVIIPTMWKSQYIWQMLPKYQESDLVGEIIIIDNFPSVENSFSNYSKVRLITKGYNIYVNPAWNWGAEIASHKIILANDDILISDFDAVLELLNSTEYDIVGIRVKGGGHTMKIEPAPKIIIGYGCFMYLKKYYKIPDALKIWAGDNFLFEKSEKKGVLVNSGLITKQHTTVYSNRKSFVLDIGRRDRIEWNKIKQDLSSY